MLWRDMHNRLQIKMEEILTILHEQSALLTNNANILRESKLRNIPIDADLLREARDIGMDILGFYDFAETIAKHTTASRCIIQEYLETCNKTGL
jgi:hypothetical protein